LIQVGGRYLVDDLTAFVWSYFDEDPSQEGHGSRSAQHRDISNIVVAQIFLLVLAVGRHIIALQIIE